MSTGAKVAVVGGIAVAATAAYLATRKKSKRA
jgi:LPXTG-motif cell wall-anchored protein